MRYLRNVFSITVILAIFLSMAVLTSAAVSPQGINIGISFDGTLPSNKGDTEVSTADKVSDNGSFWVYPMSVSNSDVSYVNAWAEAKSGANFTSAYNPIPVGNMTFIAYHPNHIPLIGTPIVLNLDNTIDMASSVNISGEWFPN